MNIILIAFLNILYDMFMILPANGLLLIDRCTLFVTMSIQLITILKNDGLLKSNTSIMINEK
jgi:hypothetical protein